MASNHAVRNRIAQPVSTYVQHVTGNVADGPTNVVVDLPPGAYTVGFGITSAANNKAVKFQVFPYSGSAQSGVGSFLGIVPAASTSMVTFTTFAITTTTRDNYASLCQGVVQNAGKAFAYPAGLRFTVTCTAAGGSGSWGLTVVAVEGT